MRKLSLLAALAGAAVMATGCMMTDHPILTDTWHKHTSGAESDRSGPYITGGQHVFEGALTLYTSDGGATWRENMSYITQNNSDLDRTHLVKTRIQAPPTTFHSDVNATAHAQGCASFTADDPTFGPNPVFDYNVENCDPGAALGVLVSVISGQAGGAENNSNVAYPWLAGSGLDDYGVLDFLGRGEASNNGLLAYEISAETFSLSVSFEGDEPMSLQLPAGESWTVYVNPSAGLPGQVGFALDLSANPAVTDAFLNLVDDARAIHGDRAIELTDATLTWYGTEMGIPSNIAMALPGSQALDTAQLREEINQDHSFSRRAVETFSTNVGSRSSLTVR